MAIRMSREAAEQVKANMEARNPNAIITILDRSGISKVGKLQAEENGWKIIETVNKFTVIAHEIRFEILEVRICTDCGTEILTKAVGEYGLNECQDCSKKRESAQRAARFVEISAGSEYGAREALYEVVETLLVLRHEGNHDNLAGNSVVLDFEGLTTEQAREKRDAINTEPVGHSWDGCHACKFSVGVREVDPPSWFTYQEPPEAEAIREVLTRFKGIEKNE